MNDRTPPKALPRSFRPIWDALKEADEKAASRQALARDLGVATHTLQRILVSGDVPSFARERNNRIRRAWARTLARLARRLERDPRSWIEAAGITWEPDIEAAVESALRDAPRDSARQPVVVAAARTGRLRARSGALRVAIVRGSPLAAALRDRGASFLDVYARRLAGAVEPERAIETVAVSEGEALADMLGPAPSFDLAAGVVETVARRAAGLRFQAIPGWRVPLAALSVRPDGVQTAVPRWTELGAAPGVRVAALDEVARSYLIAHRGLRPERLVSLPPGDGGDLAGAAGRALERAGTASLVLVGLEWNCRAASEALVAAERFEVALPPGAMKPSYPVSLACPARAGAWAALLDAARDHEVFGSAAADAALLYAETAAEIEFSGRAGSTAALKPAHFAAATPAFQQAYAFAIVQIVTGDVGAVEDLRLASLAPAERAERIASVARSLTPAEWTAALDAALARLPAMPAIEAPSTSGASRYCRSCSVSLLDGHNRGASDRYCRYCADEHGRLKPREEVHRILARWIEHWQGGMDAKEAYERAERLMSAMPAWSRN